MEQIVIGVAECAIADAPRQALVTYGLGSCIALALYDPAARIGGLLHYMLPDSAIGGGQRRNHPWVFANTAIPRLLDELSRRGAVPARIRAYAAGGACMMGAERVFDIGKRNYDALLRELSRAGLVLTGEAVGGTVSRNIRLTIATGRVRVWVSGEGAAE